MQTQQETKDEIIGRRAEEAHQLHEFASSTNTARDIQDETSQRWAEETQQMLVLPQRSNRLLDAYHHDNFDKNRVKICNCGLMNVECKFYQSCNFADEKIIW